MSRNFWKQTNWFSWFKFSSCCRLHLKQIQIEKTTTNGFSVIWITLGLFELSIVEDIEKSLFCSLAITAFVLFCFIFFRFLRFICWIPKSWNLAIPAIDTTIIVCNAHFLPLYLFHFSSIFHLDIRQLLLAFAEESWWFFFGVSHLYEMNDVLEAVVLVVSVLSSVVSLRWMVSLNSVFQLPILFRVSFKYLKIQLNQLKQEKKRNRK